MECRWGLAMRILSVRLSVSLSVTRVYCDKTVEKSVQIFIPYERAYSFPRRRMVGRGRSLLSEILGQLTPVGAKSPMIARSASAKHLAKKFHQR